MCMFSAFTYIIIVYCQTRFDLYFSIIRSYMCKVIDLVNIYENLICSIYNRVNSLGKTWKMDIKGPGKSLKITHFSVCTLCFNLST